jgi:predicted RNA-binding protein with PUA-like domain
MIEPIRHLMRNEMLLDVVVQECRAGYGIPDLVGAAISKRGCELRRKSGLPGALDHHHLVEIVLILRPGLRRSFEYLSKRVSFSESTFFRKVLPQLRAYGVVEIHRDGYVQLSAEFPNPTDYIVAVEAKQNRWRQAILQARRYRYFAEEAYVAIWKDAAARVDKALLRRHRLGLIQVENDGAEIIVEAPRLRPRNPSMNRYCAEIMFAQVCSPWGE